jgi:predicted methyltransferase
MENALTVVGRRLREIVKAGDVAIDATVGNGHDTRLLAELVGPQGVVYGFDVQPMAIESARHATADVSDGIRFVHAGHESMIEHIDQNHVGAVSAVVFNLGYLPGGDKSLTTSAETTTLAVEKSLQVLRSGGVLTVVCYRHPEGDRELSALRELMQILPQSEYTCMETSFVNQRGNPPVVFVVLKL